MTSLSLLASYDDLIRCQAVLTDDAAEVAFKQFLDSFEEYRMSFQHVQSDSNRLQRELDEAITNMSALETKLFHARRLLEMETRLRKEAENEREAMDKKMHIVRDLLRNERDIRDETRDKLAFLNSPRKRRSALMSERRINEEDEASDINSTGSLLSDMSVTKSEEDFLDCRPSKQWRKHQPSLNASMNASGKRFRLSTERKRRSSAKVFEIGPSDKIVAQTKLSLPKSGDGPIIAESIIQAKPSMNFAKIPETPKKNKAPLPPSGAHSAVKRSRSPSAPPMEEVTYATVQKQPPRTPMASGKSHQFITKTVFVQSDNCSHCGKRFRFSSNCLKCRDCRAVLHIQCRDAYTASCVLATATTPTLLKGQQMGFLCDYAPNISPMVPALIVHCVNEIEARGLQEVGIYRISGSERDVKQLKEKFLKGKSIPQVNSVDIHVLCGCIKDFLRSLQETLIPTAMWADFSNAAQSISPQLQRQQLTDAVLRLPQPNRDTLAFLVQHFQRIAACPEVKMPLENIAKVFAPTIVGYSKTNLHEHAMYAETVVQVAVMDGLLKINTEFWMQFANLERGGFQFTTTSSSDSDEQRLRDIYAINNTPSTSRITRNNNRKFYGTPPYSTIKRK